MRAFIYNLPIRHKVNLTLIGISCCVLGMALFAFLTIHGYQMKERYRSEFETLSHLTAENVQAALLFNDSEYATQMLANLDLSSAVRYAALYDDEDRLFASYVRDGSSESLRLQLHQQKPLLPSSGNRLHQTEVSSPAGNQIGVLFLEYDLGAYWDGLRVSFAWVIGILIISVALSLLIARIFHLFFSFPLVRLTQAAETLSRQSHPGTLDGSERGDEIGKLIHAFNRMVHQITRRNDELVEAARLLEVRVEERTQELRVAAQKAKAADKAKGEFLSIVSHELRTPLNPILGFTNLLACSGLEPADRECVDSIRSEAERMLELVDRILDFCKAELSSKPRNHPPSALMPKLRSACSTYRLEAAQVDLTLENGMEDKQFEAIPPVFIHYGDGEALDKIIRNLLSNAVKFGRVGSVVLRVGQRPLDGASCLLRIEVEDQGPGIPAEHIDKLFNPFSQLDTSSTRSSGGLGLGLAVCGKLAASLGGRIGVESREGYGALFWVEAPLPLRAG
jgi:signal transduction histidine kinase